MFVPSLSWQTVVLHTFRKYSTQRLAGFCAGRRRTCYGRSASWRRQRHREVRKRVCVFAPCLLTSKMIILPRQARDKHRENSQRERSFLIDVMAIKRAREDLAREQVRTRNLFLLTHSSCTKVENDQFCQARLGTNARTSVETIMTESVRFSRPIGRSC